MGAEPRVQVQSSSVRRAWKASGGTEAWLLLKASTTTTFDDFVDAMAHANARTEDDSVMGTMPSSSPLGHVVCLTGITGRAPLEAWVEAFRQELEDRGTSGRLGAAAPAEPPTWMSSSLAPVPTTFAAWTVDLDAMAADPERTGHWHVIPRATRDICSFAAGWATEVQGDVLLRQNTFVLRLNGDDVTEPLRESVQLTGMAGVDVVHDPAQQARHVALAPGGEGVFQVIDDQLTWEERLQQLRPVLVGPAEHTNHAFIRSAHRGALGVTEVDTVVPLPGIREYHVRYNKHLLGEYVPDAHGLQVLREEHLRRARDLSRWNISELGHGRYLVEAPDLHPWYAGAIPDAQVLEQARKDFGAMLLTEEVIQNHPAPWL